MECLPLESPFPSYSGVILLITIACTFQQQQKQWDMSSSCINQLIPIQCKYHQVYLFRFVLFYLISNLIYLTKATFFAIIKYCTCMQMFEREKNRSVQTTYVEICKVSDFIFCLLTLCINYRNNVEYSKTFFLVIHHNFQNKQNVNQGTDDC